MSIVFWRSASSGADFSGVDSQAAADRLARQGELVELLMFPAMFGGDARPENIVHVPRDVADRKAQIDECEVRPLVEAGQVVEYSVVPEWQEGCHVPVALVISALAGATPSFFRLAIWGKGLSAPPS